MVLCISQKSILVGDGQEPYSTTFRPVGKDRIPEVGPGVMYDANNGELLIHRPRIPYLKHLGPQLLQATDIETLVRR